MPFFGSGFKLGSKALGVGAAALRRALSRSKAKNKSKSRGRVGNRAKRVPQSNERNWIDRPLTIPSGKNMDFTYCLYSNMNTADGTNNLYGTQHLFKMNDPFDPDSGAGALSCLYWDEMSALYLRYRVHACTVEVRWMTTNVTEVISCAVNISNSSSAVDLTGKTAAYVGEMPLTNVLQISPGGEHSFLVSSRRFDLAKIEGESWFTRSADYQALMTATPANGPKVRLAVSCVSNSVQQTGIYYQLRLIYHTHLFERKIPAQSA